MNNQDQKMDVRVSDLHDLRDFKREFQRGSKNKKRKGKDWDSFRRNKRDMMWF